ncbi:efflux RND transporter periplasmic adaptor subunit [Actinoplanes sp. NPDC051851]|uniref:efflux RND transporter periplasmic adaptor subunit n=1 Tax=Actinoplanes sp. NPDC051851 TaxID=3154753 RepID=UPI0034482465
MRRRNVLISAATAVVALAGCSETAEQTGTPGLEARGTVLTTVQPTRQDLTDKLSLSGKVEINPVFGIAAPADGELRYMDRRPAKTAAASPIWVATVWDEKGAPRRVNIPKGSILAGRLLEDHADVTAGMPVISATHAGYAIVADIDSASAYRVSGAAKSVKAQIKNGPGPFTCETLGTIAALPAGTIPAAPVTTTEPTTGASAPVSVTEEETTTEEAGSEATGMRLVCVPASNVKLINGADVTLEVVTSKAEDVLTLPVEAVAGVQGKGKVDVVTGTDRTRTTVDVTLGISDGKVIEIKKGLTGDETIAVPGPDLPAATAENGEVTG